jgi:DNA-binding transcriptional LysR family regulator
MLIIAMDLLDKMQTYVRVVEAGSFSAAAKQLRLSAAAVSRQIATLEGELRAELIARSTRRMAVTATGRRYYERCIAILREVDDAHAAAAGDVATGLLKVSAPVTFGLASVVPHMAALAVKHPELRVDLKLEDRQIDLVLDGVDIAVRVGAAPPLTTELVAHRLGEFRRVAVASPSYLRKRGTPKQPDELAGHDALSHAYDGSGMFVTLVDNDREQHVRLAVRFSSNSGHVLRELAIAGAGIALLPAWFVADSVERGELRRILGAWQSPPVPVHALHRTAQRGESRVRTFVDHLRSSMRL